MMSRRPAPMRHEFSFSLSSPARGNHDDDVRRFTVLPPPVGEEDFRRCTVLPARPTATNQQSYQQRHRLYPASAGSSPSPSRAQAIAGYRREMLDLVSGLPEASYELSLRDIVDSRAFPPPPLPPPPPPTAMDGKNKTHSGDGDGDGHSKKQAKAVKSRTVMRTRSRSMDTGMLIKLFLPLSVSRRKKVSPKPAAAANSGNNGEKKKKHGKKKKDDDEEWCKKSEFSEEGGRSSRTSSTSSTNSTGNGGGGGGGTNPPAATSTSRKSIGCYSFLRANKSKNGVIKE